MEEQFIDGRPRVTASIHVACDSYGSRLHKCQDGKWLAYARWPDEATRESCEHQEVEGQRLMREAVAERYEDTCRSPGDPARQS